MLLVLWAADPQSRCLFFFFELWHFLFQFSFQYIWHIWYPGHLVDCGGTKLSPLLWQEQNPIIRFVASFLFGLLQYRVHLNLFLTSHGCLMLLGYNSSSTRPSTISSRTRKIARFSGLLQVLWPNQREVYNELTRVLRLFLTFLFRDAATELIHLVILRFSKCFSSSFSGIFRLEMQ